jgi:hypothetical protein
MSGRRVLISGAALVAVGLDGDGGRIASRTAVGARAVFVLLGAHELALAD